MPYVVNGNSVDLPSPVLTDGTTFVPVADLANALGGYVDWNHEAKSARIEIGDMVGHVNNDDATVEVNGTAVDIKAKPYIQDGVLWAPVRLFRFAYGMKLSVDGDTVTIDRF
jgi:hypothetical protein